MFLASKLVNMFPRRIISPPDLLTYTRFENSIPGLKLASTFIKLGLLLIEERKKERKKKLLSNYDGAANTSLL